MPVSREEQTAARQERLHRIERMRDEGMTQAQIAAVEGVTRSRISALLNARPHRRPRRPGAAAVSAAQQEREARNAAILRVWRRGRKTQAQIAVEHDVSLATVMAVVRAHRRRT